MIAVREIRWQRKFLTWLAECRAGWLLISGLWLMSGLLAQAQSPPDLSSNAPAPFSTSIIIQDSKTTPTVYGTETFDELTETNFASDTNSISLTGTNGFATKLATARLLVKSRQSEKAEALFVELLAANVPEPVQKAALLGLGAVVRDENDLPRAQTIYAQYLSRWPGDIHIPEVLLRQGQLFRQMGLTDLALGKFYSVMTSALSLKNDQLAYYQRLVLQTQIEIAETHYLMGHYADAADFYSRLLASPDPALPRPQMQFRLIRSLAIIQRNDQAVSQAEDFLARYPDADDAPEVRYYFAEALKALGRNNEALQQVLLCLREQKIKTKNHPEVWAYWQQRVGNEIGNQLYREGDYVKALEIFINLAKLDSSPNWQIPVYYQMAATYEQLLQPQKAIETYGAILAREAEVGTNMTPSLQAVFDMARWRQNFVKWQGKAEGVQPAFTNSAPALANSETNSTP
jgi:tetratricopeptide (TPR) repeat protein